MKDSGLSKGLSISDEAEKFQAKFAEQRADIENRLLVAGSVPQEALKDFFVDLNSSLQSLQKLYSASSPYLRIYYRKVYQDALQSLQTSIQETEEKCIPRKKFVFKGNRGKNKTQSVVSIGAINPKEKSAQLIDEVDRTNSCVYQDRTDADIFLPAEDINGKAILLSRLKNCKVRMEGAPSTVHITEVSNCELSCGPVSSSVFVESAQGCSFQLACQQLRIHETSDTDFFVHVTSKAIIEECKNVRFGVYTFTYPTIDQDYKSAGLPLDVNNWKDIDDFNWLVTGQPSPNWSLIENSSR